MSESIIKVLDEHTANKIAAGEVVERPASIVKELVENALDAGSSSIEIEIADGGASYIRVTDNGSGMNQHDAKMAVLRHATSKIRDVEDLYSISSLGFRGEALPSIAAVSRFTLTTRPQDEDMATYVELAGGQMTDVREAGANTGTTIVVQDLFFNTPARKKFLKSAAAESSHIHDIVAKLALSHPETAYKLINNGKLVMATPGNNSLTDTLASLYGQRVVPDLIPVSYEDDGISISGVIGKPTLLKSNRQWQTLIVNLRVVGSRFISKALDTAYHSLLPKSGYPLAVLRIMVPLESIDVNVHPQKSEIKFSDEQRIFRAVHRAVTAVLTAQQDPGQLAAMVPPSFTVPQLANRPETVRPRQQELYVETPRLLVPTYETEPALPFAVARERKVEQDHWLPGIADMPAAEPMVAAAAVMTTQDMTSAALAAAQPAFSLQPLGQIEECYIIAEGPDGLYIVDQHAAHERILYDRLAQKADTIPVQQLLVPLFLEFTPDDVEMISRHAELFAQLGFSLSEAGPNTIRLLEIPADIPTAEAESIMREILTEARKMNYVEAKALRHACLQITSCRAAIKAGDSLNMRQMQALLTELCATDLSYTCPHGRPAMIRFSPQDLAKMFKRI